MFQSSLLVAFGGALGSLSRFWLGEAFIAWLGADFPWGTVVVNITGCFIVGFFGVLTGPDGPFPVSTLARQFVMIGICGGYTTFSSFSWQTLDLAQRGAWGLAAANVIASVVLCLLAVWAGATAAALFSHIKITP